MGYNNLISKDTSNQHASFLLFIILISVIQITLILLCHCYFFVHMSDVYFLSGVGEKYE